MSEIRKNLLTGEYVMIAPQRAARPGVQDHGAPTRSLAPREATCPFCPGNEAETPPTTYRAPAEGPWRVRAFPNRYSILDPDGTPWRRVERMHVATGASGPHEVICESDRHDFSIALATQDEAIAVVRAYVDRYAALYRDPRVAYVSLFKNHGPQAGCTVPHPHSQIVGLPMVPKNHERRANDAERYFEFVAECPVCRIVHDEVDAVQRIVASNEHFVAVVPWAALSSHHTWILPTQHATSFGETDDATLVSFANILRRVLGALRSALGDPDYNLSFVSTPPSYARSPFLHWYASLVPRVTQIAGFELGTAISVNPSLPEESAAHLRAFLPKV
jgi:UDPglucose--hexose-1-phosphate uridylyltransferase